MATILIIDDEEPIRALLRTTLEAAGHEVMEAPNGRIGLELYRHRPTNLVITDILMPELNGLDLLLELTREFLHAKVIAISGAGSSPPGCRRRDWVRRGSSQGNRQGSDGRGESRRT